MSLMSHFQKSERWKSSVLFNTRQTNIYIYVHMHIACMHVCVTENTYVHILVWVISG